MLLLVVIPAVLAFACWMSAFVHWLLLFGHLRPGVSAMKLVLSGISAFDADNFTEAGHPVQRRMLYSFLGFFLCAVGAGLVGAVVLR